MTDSKELGIVCNSNGLFWGRESRSVRPLRAELGPVGEAAGRWPSLCVGRTSHQAVSMQVRSGPCLSAASPQSVLGGQVGRILERVLHNSQSDVL